MTENQDSGPNIDKVIVVKILFNRKTKKCTATINGSICGLKSIDIDIETKKCSLQFNQEENGEIS